MAWQECSQLQQKKIKNYGIRQILARLTRTPRDLLRGILNWDQLSKCITYLCSTSSMLFMPEQDVGTISTAPTQTAINIHLKFEYMGAKHRNSLPFDTCKLYMTSFVLCVVHVLCCYVTLPFYGYHPLTPFVVFFLSLSSSPLPPPPPPPPPHLCILLSSLYFSIVQGLPP